MYDVKYNYIYDNKNYSLNQYHLFRYNPFSYERTYAIYNSYWLNTNKNVIKKDLKFNEGKLTNKLVNYCLLKGKKLLAYNIFKNSFCVFFTFFEHFNSELLENYPLYKLFCKHAVDHPTLFFNSHYILYSIINLLESVFVIKIKKVKQSSKVNKIQKEIFIGYIPPHKRNTYSLKLFKTFCFSFSYEKAFLKLTYGILSTFLSHKNSVLYKKKMSVYNRLLTLRKIK